MAMKDLFEKRPDGRRGHFTGQRPEKNFKNPKLQVYEGESDPSKMLGAVILFVFGFMALLCIIVAANLMYQ